MKKKEVKISKANRLINFGTVVLVTSKSGEKTDITPVAWNTPLSHDPMLVGVSLAKKHCSHDLISKSGEYVINVPGADLISKVAYCGSVSGRDADKFRESKLSISDAAAVSVPLISECIAHIECRVEHKYDVGDHTLFVGRVVGASAVDGFLSPDFIPDVKKFRTLQHLGGASFGTLKEAGDA